jgi:hypothetical protein
MNPKPFWPLNHFTVPVVILFSKARKRVPRDNHAVISTSSMSLEKEPAGAFNKAQRLIEWRQYIRHFGFYKTRDEFETASSCPCGHCQRPRASACR